jgi:hypothetical protein
VDRQDITFSSPAVFATAAFTLEFIHLSNSTSQSLVAVLNDRPLLITERRRFAIFEAETLVSDFACPVWILPELASDAADEKSGKEFLGVDSSFVDIKLVQVADTVLVACREFRNSDQKHGKNTCSTSQQSFIGIF